MYLGHFLLVFLILVEAEKVSYFSVERPQIEYLDTKVVLWANMTSRRVGRRDMLYYFNFSLESVVYFGNNVTVNFYFLEFLTNRYKPSFVEMHFRLCDLIEKDNFFGTGMRSGTFGNKKCPYGPGNYTDVRWQSLHCNYLISQIVDIIQGGPQGPCVRDHNRDCNIKMICFYYGKGVYHIQNGTIPVTSIPKGFPFSKGRIFVNATYAGDHILTAHVDIELKQMKRSKS